MNILIRQLRMDRKALCLWTLGMLFLVAACVGKMSAMVGDNSAALTAMLVLLPAPLRNLFGLGTVDYSQPIGIFAVVAPYMALVAALHAAGLGVALFAREERDKTFEFLYVKGRSRSFILSAKLLAGILQLMLLNALTYAFSALVTRLALGAAIARSLLPIMAGVLIMQLLFFAAGLLASLLTRSMQFAGAIASAGVLYLFLADMLIYLTGSRIMVRVSPF